MKSYAEIVILSISLLAVAIAGIWTVTYFTADVRGKIDANERIKADGAFRIAAYERFFDSCSAIQATEGRIKTQEDELKATKNDQFRTRQIRTNLAALRGQRIEQITKYNTDAAKSYTIGQFRSSNLPYNLPINNGDTICALS